MTPKPGTSSGGDVSSGLDGEGSSAKKKKRAVSFDYIVTQAIAGGEKAAKEADEEKKNPKPKKFAPGEGIDHTVFYNDDHLKIDD